MSNSPSVDPRLRNVHEMTGDVVNADVISANQLQAAHSETPTTPITVLTGGENPTPSDRENLGVNDGPGGGRTGSNPTNPTPTTDPSTVEKEGVNKSDSSQSQGKPAPADSDDG